MDYYLLPVRMCKITKPTVFFSQHFKPQRHVRIKKGYTDDLGAVVYWNQFWRMCTPHSKEHTGFGFLHLLPVPTLQSVFFVCIFHSWFLQPSVQPYPHSIPSIPNIFLHLFSTSFFLLFLPSFPYLSSFFLPFFLRSILFVEEYNLRNVCHDIM